MAHDREKDRQDLATALDAVRRDLPNARYVWLETSDQSMGYGFWFDSVQDADGNDIEVPDALFEEVRGLIEDIDWNGPVGEDAHGYARLDLTIAPTHEEP